MSLCEDFMKRSINFFETNNKRFKIKSSIVGMGFTSNKEKHIPPGEYIVVEPDDRDKSRIVIVKKDSYEMYSIPKSSIPN